MSTEIKAMKPELFPLGTVVVTPGFRALQKRVIAGPAMVLALLERHKRGDWGDVDPDDAKSNDEAVSKGYRLMSAYQVFNYDGQAEVVWVITEADRSSTTMLLPEEY